MDSDQQQRKPKGRPGAPASFDDVNFLVLVFGGLHALRLVSACPEIWRGTRRPREPAEDGQTDGPEEVTNCRTDGYQDVRAKVAFMLRNGWNPTPCDVANASVVLGISFTKEEFLETCPDARELRYEGFERLGFSFTKKDFFSSRPRALDLVTHGLELGIEFTKRDLLSLNEPPPDLVRVASLLGIRLTRSDLAPFPVTTALIVSALKHGIQYTKEEFLASVPSPRELCSLDMDFGFTKEEFLSTRPNCYELSSLGPIMGFRFTKAVFLAAANDCVDLCTFGENMGFKFTRREFMALAKKPIHLVLGAEKLDLSFSPQDFLSTRPTASELWDYGVLQLRLSFTKRDLLSLNDTPVNLVRAAGNLGVRLTRSDLATFTLTPQLIATAHFRGIGYTKEEFLAAKPNCYELSSLGPIMDFRFSKQEFLAAANDCADLLEYGEDMGFTFTRREFLALAKKPIHLVYGAEGLGLSFSPQDFLSTRPTIDELWYYGVSELHLSFTNRDLLSLNDTP